MNLEETGASRNGLEAARKMMEATGATRTTEAVELEDLEYRDPELAASLRPFCGYVRG